LLSLHRVVAATALASILTSCADRPDGTMATASPSVQPAQLCTPADLDRPPPEGMPRATQVRESITVGDRQGRDVQISPPHSASVPQISSEGAWKSLSAAAKPGGGEYRLLLGRIEAPFPTVPQPDGSTTPILSGQLAWSLVVQGRAVPSDSGSQQPCAFEDSVSAVDAQTGSFLGTATFRNQPR
jgi:hypothetical protein